ncbi:hypothetical protein PPYR_07144 [Photinus pyralis]|uniref:Integrase catalytic domain-containing protein n=2 Tax=Photinus pyralis TaxID=7054 RepID=A0A5N4APM1_PHOPY|nr:hypothetical protein PPYR_07144 [Photinus pyralis]
MDDFLSGSSSESEAIGVRTQLQDMLQSTGFHICKWSSNSRKVLQSIPDHLRAIEDELKIDTTDTVKTLGLVWHPSSDTFNFKSTPFNEKVTKRTTLSDIAKLFDPLGFVSPIVILAKLFMQLLWTEEVDWDEQLPNSLMVKWLHIKHNLQEVSCIRVPRCIVTTDTPKQFHLFGFSDASSQAYGACLYLIVIYENETITSRLILSKSKVAPLKTQSIPKLELCGFLMLSDLLESIKKTLNLSLTSIKAFTDSTIVRFWCRKESFHWKVFVANRVAKVRNILKQEEIHHVPTDQNPADLISRGVETSILKESELWWHGPQSLIRQLLYDNEIKTDPILTSEDEKQIQGEQKPHLEKAVRVLAYVQRFIINVRNIAARELRWQRYLKYSELFAAKLLFARQAQLQEYEEETLYLQKGFTIAKSSKLLSCNPFYDVKNQVLRVGGRLEHSDLPFSRKHPIILPPMHRFTRLLFESQHRFLLHAGPSFLLSHVRRQWWPINGKRVATSVYRKCVKCFHVNPTDNCGQLMGNLPASRVCRPSKVFINSGCDYAGPFFVLQHHGKRCKTFSKAYVALFVCMATKAVHLEVVTDTRTEKYIAALRRFIAVRGKVAEMNCDNGSNFHGADSEMKDFRQMLNSVKTKEALEKTFSEDGIKFNYIPGNSPHMRGLWESNVKAVKYHMKRIIGNSKLNFEEFYTLIKQIEACLNSRPLCKLTDDPDDMQILTSGHFITGDSMVAIPEPDYTTVPCNRLKRFQLVQSMFQNFWNIYRNIVFGDLQVRTKWKQPKENLKTGDLVLVKDDNQPPLQW